MRNLMIKRYSPADVCAMILNEAHKLSNGVIRPNGQSTGIPLLAKKMHLTPIYLWIVLERRQDPGPAILDYYGLRKAGKGQYVPRWIDGD